MQTILERIVDQISTKDILHSKKIRKNLKKFKEPYFREAEIFFKRYENMLKKDNKTIDYAVDCYLQMIADFNHETTLFAQTGEYSNKSFAEVNQKVYNNPDVMEYHMHGLLLSQFLWKHHYETLLWFNTVINKNSADIRNYLEVGGGHGLYISEAMKIIGEKATYDLVDISQSSMNIAHKMIPDDSMVNYTLSDIFDYHPSKKYDFITMGEVLEHVEDPVKLLKRLHSLLGVNGKLLITTPTNAPSLDHIFLFKSVDDIRKVIIEADFQIVDEICTYSEDVSPEVAEKYKISMLYGGVLIKQE